MPLTLVIPAANKLLPLDSACVAPSSITISPLGEIELIIHFFLASNFDTFGKNQLQLLFLIIYISNQHSVEKQIREINKLEKDVEELRTDYVTLNNNYMFSRKESEILKRVKKIGLENSKLPPEKISNKE